jgi:hypothetical protein
VLPVAQDATGGTIYQGGDVSLIDCLAYLPRLPIDVLNIRLFS